jgi:hypothetical protein
MSVEKQAPTRLDSLDEVAVSIPESVLSHELEGEVVLLDVNNGEYYGLDPVGSRMWVLLEENLGNVGRTLEILRSEFDIDRETLAKDLANFLAKLRFYGLLNRDRGSNSSD